jgi:pSer/pThr/pTyr-binding forkhead associated (FHA) protein
LAIRIHITDDELDAPEPDRTVEFEKGPVLFGRSRTNHVVFGGPLVSRVHFELHLQTGGWVVLARGSLLPTLLNGEQLERERARPVKEGDRIVVGGLTAAIGLPIGIRPPPGAWGASAQEETWLPGRTSDEWKPAARDWLELVLEAGPETQGATVRLPLVEEGRAYVLGRSSDSDLRLQHGAVSRRHLQLRRAGDEVVLTDLGSKNPARLDGEPIRGTVRMRVGSVLQIGPLRLSLARAEGKPPGSGISTAGSETRRWAAQDVVPPAPPPPSAMTEPLPPARTSPSSAPISPPSAVPSPALPLLDAPTIETPRSPPPRPAVPSPAAPPRPPAPAAPVAPAAPAAAQPAPAAPPRPSPADEYAMTEAIHTPFRSPPPAPPSQTPPPPQAPPAASRSSPPPAPPSPPRPPAPPSQAPPAPPVPPRPPVPPPVPAAATAAPRPAAAPSPPPAPPAPPRAPAAPATPAAADRPDTRTPSSAPEPSRSAASDPALSPSSAAGAEPDAARKTVIPAASPAGADSSPEHLADLFVDPVRLYSRPKRDIPVWVIVLVVLLVIGAVVALWAAFR